MYLFPPPQMTKDPSQQTVSCVNFVKSVSPLIGMTCLSQKQPGPFLHQKDLPGLVA